MEGRTIVDLSMGETVALLVKLAIAAIPALFLVGMALSALGFLLAGVFMAIFGA